MLSENIFRNSVEGIVITDREGIIESVNPAFSVITGFSEDEAIGENPRILKSQRHGPDFYRKMWDDLIEKGYWEGEIWNRRKDGSVYPEYLTINSMRNLTGETTNFISFFHDLSAIKEKEARIDYEATHDQLTGLPNREFLGRAMAALIEKVENDSGSFSVVYIDIINIKRINESLGPESGDMLLVESSERMQKLILPPNLLVRVGSDEFVCLMKDSHGGDDISAAVSEIFACFDQPFLIKEHHIDIGIAIGVSSYPDDGSDPMDLVAKAEAAMRASKNDVNNSFTFYSSDFREKGLSRIEIESGLRNAFENRKFFLNYQPKVSSETGRLTGAEALLRVEPIKGQFIGPDIFIPIAEEIGLIEPLGTWVLEKACKDLNTLNSLGYRDFHIAVNLSPRQFRKAELPDIIRNIITSSGVRPENLNLEITEGMAIDNVEESIRMMKNLSDIGVKLSIDDFGTGYSSLSYLSQFPVDTLKIDKIFVVGIPDDPKRTGIVQTILSLSENLGMNTVAEGVETEEQFLYLKQRGSPDIQGYYFYKPMVFSDLLDVLKKEESNS